MQVKIVKLYFPFQEGFRNIDQPLIATSPEKQIGIHKC